MFTFFCALFGMDTFDILPMSGSELEERLHNQEPERVVFNGGLQILLPIYFTTYHRCNAETIKERATNKEFLQEQLKDPSHDEHISFSPSFFENYPQKFTCVYEMRNLIVDGHPAYTEENNLHTVFNHKLFWLNKRTAIDKGSGNQLYSIELHDNAPTFSYRKIFLYDKKTVKDYAQHPLQWDHFYVMLSKSYFSTQGTFKRIKIDTTAAHVVASTKFKLSSLFNPILIIPHDSDIAIIMSICNTYYILGKKSYHNGGTSIQLELNKGIKRLAYVNTIVQKDFIKAVVNRKTTIAQRDSFFENHPLRAKFLDHWISYKIAQIEGK